MGSVIACLLAKAEIGKIGIKDAQTIEKEINRLKSSPQNNDVLSELDAAKKAHSAAAFQLSQKQLNLTRSAELQARLVTSMEAGKASGVSTPDSFKALFFETQHTANSYKPEVADQLSAPIEAYVKNATNKYEALIYNSISQLQRDPVTGKINATLSREIGESLFALERGLPTPKVSEEAVRASKALLEASQFGAKERIRLGSLVDHPHDNIMGVRSSPTLMRLFAAKIPNFKEKWIAHVMKLGVDVDHLNATFGTSIRNDSELKLLLDGAYKALLSGGPIDKSGTLVPMNLRNIAKANNLHRGLRFKDAKGTMEFINTYGAGNMYDHVLSWANTRGVEDGVAEIMGSSPRSTQRAILEHIKSTDPEFYQEAAGLFDRYADHLGIYHASSSLEDGKLTPVATNAKNLFRASVLGRVGLWQTTLDMWGLPTMVNSLKGLPVIKNIQMAYSELFRSSAHTAETRALLAKHGFALSEMLKEGQDILLSLADRGLTKKSAAYTTSGADAIVQKVTGGTRAINATLRASQQFMLNELSELVEKGNILAHGEAQANYLKSFGFDQKVLDFIKSNAFKQGYFEDHPFLAIDKAVLHNIDSDEARNAALALTRILEDQKKAVNPVIPQKLAAWAQNIKKTGTAGRIGADAVTTLASYISGYANNMLEMSKTLGGSRRMHLLATGLVMYPMITGYAMTVISDLMSGKDAPPLSSDIAGKVIGRAFGPLGDAMVSGGEPQGNVLGSLFPLANFFLDAAGNTVKVGKDVATGQFDKIPADSVKVLSRLMPGQTAPVFGLLLKKYVTDQILLATDPHATRKFRQNAKSRESKTGASAWWRDGELAPERAPDLSKLLTIYEKRD